MVYKEKISCMKIVIINCHWDNRGDEAAIRAMIDELQVKYPAANIYVQRALGKFGTFPENDHVKVLPPFPIGGKKRKIQEHISIATRGRINLTSGAKAFYKAINGADIVLHAPGGPSIGDIYLPQERIKLKRLMAVKKAGIPYAFYAPSMGPFKNKERNPMRKEILEGASLICLREDISARMVKEFVPSSNPIVTLDSAFQHDIDMQTNEEQLNKYTELKDFIGDGQAVIGVTITDLQWNSLYKDDGKTKENIRKTFVQFIQEITELGYKVLFIPQLFDGANDYEYMKSFANPSCYVMSDKFDCYFQQYIIGRIKAVVGMRYHSNIFSAKMGTPFVSVSYEQKMQGFMKKAGLLEYCLPISELSSDNLRNKFENMMNNYVEYKNSLEIKKKEFKKESSKTTELVCRILNC